LLRLSCPLMGRTPSRPPSGPIPRHPLFPFRVFCGGFFFFWFGVFVFVWVFLRSFCNSSANRSFRRIFPRFPHHILLIGAFFPLKAPFAFFFSFIFFPSPFHYLFSLPIILRFPPFCPPPSRPFREFPLRQAIICWLAAVTISESALSSSLPRCSFCHARYQSRGCFIFMPEHNRRCLYHALCFFHLLSCRPHLLWPSSWFLPPLRQTHPAPSSLLLIFFRPSRFSHFPFGLCRLFPSFLGSPHPFF